jgi:hypothetical protein
MTARFVHPLFDVGIGITPSSGAKLFFFEDDGVTPKDTHTTKAGVSGEPGNLNANPVIALSTGVFPDIYITGDYKITLKDKNDVQIGTGLLPINEFAAVTDAAFVKNFATLADAIEDTGLVDGDTYEVEEHTASNGGPGTWDVVLKSAFPSNGIDIRDTNPVSLLTNKLRVGWILDLRAVGINGDGVTENQDLIINRALAHPDSTFVTGRSEDTYFINKPVIVGENKTLNGNNCNFTSEIGKFTYASLPFTAMIVLGDPDDRLGTKKENCHVMYCNLEFTFLGDINISADIDTLANYTSPTQYGIRAQLTNNSSISHCLVSGFETTLIGAEWSDNFRYHDNTLSIARFHGIANQGGVAVARNHKVYRNTVSNIGGIAFDINTVTGSIAHLTDNDGSNVKQFYKVTDGTAITKGNVFTSWQESSNIFSAYGNSQGLKSTDDIMTDFSRLTASGSENVDYQWENITYTSIFGRLMTIQDNSIYKIQGVIDIIGDALNAAAMVDWGGSATKTGTSLSITNSNCKFDTTAISNSATLGVFSLGGWTNCNFNISNNEKFEHTGLSLQRIIVDISSLISSTDGLFTIANNNINAVGIDAQFGMNLKDAHNCSVHDNGVKGVAIGSFETTFGSAVNFHQYNNLTNVEFTAAIGTNKRIYDYYLVGRSTLASPIGVVTPERIGELHFDGFNSVYYKAFGLANTQWKLIT